MATASSKMSTIVKESDSENKSILTKQYIDETLESLENKLKTNPSSAQATINELEVLQRDMHANETNLSSKELKLVDRKLTINRRAAEFIGKGFEYDRAYEFAEKTVVAEENVEKPFYTKPGVLLGTGALVLAAGIGGTLLYQQLSHNSVTKLAPGQEAPTLKAYQGVDNSITAPIDKLPALPAEVSQVMAKAIWNVEPKAFFGQDYAKLDQNLQSYLAPADQLPKLTDGIVAKDNAEITGFHLFTEKSGGMTARIDMKSVSEDGSILPYEGRPFPITDSQAVQILKAYGDLK